MRSMSASSLTLLCRRRQRQAEQTMVSCQVAQLLHCNTVTVHVTDKTRDGTMSGCTLIVLEHFHRYLRAGSLMQHVHSMLCRGRDVSACLCCPLDDNLSRCGMPMLKGNLQGGWSPGPILLPSPCPPQAGCLSLQRQYMLSRNDQVLRACA